MTFFKAVIVAGWGGRDLRGGGSINLWHKSNLREINFCGLAIFCVAVCFSGSNTCDWERLQLGMRGINSGVCNTVRYTTEYCFP